MNSSDSAFPRQYLCLLINHLKQAYSSTSQRLESMLQHGHITYDLLWALFKPGSHVFTTCFNTKEPRCVIFDAGEEVTHNDETWFNLECRFLDYDGVKFGEAGIFLRVPKFRGSKLIETLEAFPLCHHPRHQDVREDLVKRGQKFRDLAGSHIRHCNNGSAFFISKGKVIKVNINSRVAVDAAFFHEMLPNYSRPSLRDLGVKGNNGIGVFDLGAMLIEDRERQKERMQGDGMEAQNLCESNFLVACPSVCCFSFKEKIFLECAVSAIGNVDWSPKSLDCLQIPSQTQTLLLSMAKTRLGLIPTLPFDDVIDGKGQGLNILLDGPPGVGKTFTVEATSEYFKLPLYSISAGELDVRGDPNVLEQQLEAIFKIAKHFKAVLLLDEADAFMEQRTAYHDTHNRLVTVFLRKLEYYQGIFFLTSNRGIHFDDAILSRIHLTIKYKELSREFCNSLWKNFLNRACTVQGPAMIDEHDLRRLESLALNGREVGSRSLLCTSHLLT
ncbi:P-loop containing nucleoside triphosphate hydrolase protein [Aspergillus pseudoustus]|uniref:P-loop containing nucleoside triphosphate hydrolase protein n=1 Tax=Aspergillus pseudoustus TaxID=1810923 RepID=A0ABR4JNY4_9EURO